MYGITIQTNEKEIASVQLPFIFNPCDNTYYTSDQHAELLKNIDPEDINTKNMLGTWPAWLNLFFKLMSNLGYSFGDGGKDIDGMTVAIVDFIRRKYPLTVKDCEFEDEDEYDEEDSYEVEISDDSPEGIQKGLLQYFYGNEDDDEDEDSKLTYEEEMTLLRAITIDKNKVVSSKNNNNEDNNDFTS